MRRQVEISRKDTFGFIAFALFWLIALTALSASAHGLEKTLTAAPQPPSPAPSVSTDKQAVSPAAAAQATPSQSEAEPDQILTRFILISIPDRLLALIDNGEVVKVYPIAVGKNESPSPTGDFTIISQAENPTYSHEGKTVPPGKNNPVGSRWMGLSLKGYGIHGTNMQSSVGKAASHGCFRMKKADVEELFKLVHVGDTVSVRGEHDELVELVFGAGSKPQETKVAANTSSAPNSEALTANGGQE